MSGFCFFRGVADVRFQVMKFRDIEFRVASSQQPVANSF